MTEKAKAVVTKKKASLVERLKNPIFVLAAASFTYKVLDVYHVAPELTLYQSGVDLLTWVLIGTGVYSTFGKNK
jgi:soluble cytochrome b562